MPDRTPPPTSVVTFESLPRLSAPGFVRFAQAQRSDAAYGESTVPPLRGDGGPGTTPAPETPRPTLAAGSSRVDR